jgi:CRISPR-associated exonuclease Cas4
MSDSEEELLPLSGIQHFTFCRRQWALIHLEGQWAENLRTTQGQLFHERAHDSQQRERRGDTLILRDLSVFSHTLGLSGKCDVVEFHADPQGVPLQGESGLWTPFPVEYKRGAPKEHDADRLQLCAQAICLEEMLCCAIPEGALFYGETRRREPVLFDESLRAQVSQLSEQMHQMFRRGTTPAPPKGRSCGACSLKELCLPKLCRAPAPSQYLRDHVREEDDP